MEAQVAQLQDEVKSLRAALTRVQDEQEIMKVHYKYGYYLDKCLYQQVYDMWSEHPDAFVEFLGGRYRGKAGIHRLYIDRFRNTFVNGRNGPIRGFLLDHAMMQPIIDVDEDGTHAWARIRALMNAGTHKSIQGVHPRGHVQWMEGGLYENEYIKENGVWKPFRYRYFPFWHATHEQGVSYTKENYVPFPKKTFPEDPLGPDELIERPMLWPDTRVVPFHYSHPVTGKPVTDPELRAPGWGQDVSTSELPLTLSS
ncbi:SnoaL-like domain-containing protein [Lineolata rhizophorae]|uniref:SnoaL-like domain-containing protein n=1 Tax=Lineolata rhizophorae TaxID=578093 RepID=A0A6A6NW93_9PEZI|nr:SnoaL-like domain-containing protein [Lineolata rhizophorae]